MNNATNGRPNLDKSGRLKAKDIPVRKPIPRPPAPDLSSLKKAIPPKRSYPVDSTAVADLYDRASRPAPEGEINRKTLTFTITPQTDDEWRDFLHTYTGTRPQRGKGISSAMVELSMQLLMGVVADFKLNELGMNLHEVCASDVTREKVKANLRNLANQI